MLLLVFQDTFFDEEDGDTRSMKASLLTGNRTEIPPWDWLQFDSSNQEFYGVPLKQDVGSKPYQLIVKDREGKEKCLDQRFHSLSCLLLFFQIVFYSDLFFKRIKLIITFSNILINANIDFR